MTGPCVLHSTDIWLPSTQTWLHNQIRFLPRRINTHVVCGRGENLDLFPVDNLHVLRVQNPARFILEKALIRAGIARGLPFVGDIARRVGARIIHSHFGPGAWADAPAAARAKALHVATFYGYDIDQLPNRDPAWALRYQDLFQSVDRVLCEGPHMGRKLEARGCPAAKIRVHPLGVDLDRLAYRPRLRARGEPLRVLLAASFREKKGLPDAMRALGRIRKEVVLEITVIGEARNTPEDQKEKARILEAVLEAGLERHVRFLGYQCHDRLHEEAARHHVFLQPSRHASDGDSEGGAPVTLIEMAATGMPIVSTEHCDIPQVVLHGQTGLLAPEGDVDALAAQLLWCARRPDAWRPMLDAGRVHIERQFDAAGQGLALADLYEDLLNPRPAQTWLPQAA